MKLLVLDQFSEMGGAQQCLLDLLPAIRERGWTALIGMPGGGEMFERARGLGFEAEAIECGPYESGRKSVVDWGRFATRTPLLVQQIRKLGARAGAELLYVNGPRVLPAAALAGLDCRIVFHTHSFVKRGPARRLAGMALRKLNARLVGQSRFVTEPWKEYVDAGRIDVIYNGVAGPERPIERPTRPAPHVGCIGRIAPEKGQMEFVKAAALIHRALPQCRFAIYGAAMFGGAQYESRVRSAAASLPVDFAGWVDDVYDAMTCLDVLLVPSAAAEGTTRVILEAFAAGLPVVAFGSGGIPEVVEHGVNGMLVNSVEEMAEAAVRLLKGDGPTIGRAARETWERRFRVERWREELLRVLATP